MRRLATGKHSKSSQASSQGKRCGRSRAQVCHQRVFASHPCNKWWCRATASTARQRAGAGLPLFTECRCQRITMGDFESIPMPLRFNHGKAGLPHRGWLAAPQVWRLACVLRPTRATPTTPGMSISTMAMPTTTTVTTTTTATTTTLSVWCGSVVSGVCRAS